MADPAEQLPAEDPFAQVMGGAAPSAAEDDSDNPFAKVMPKPVAPETSMLGAAGHAVARSILPTAASLPAAGAGARVGATLGTPFGGWGRGIGAFVGGVGGAMAGAEAVSAAQDWALEKLPEGWTEALGQDERTRRLEEGQHPIASFMGGIAPFLVTMSPQGIAESARALPVNATALQRILAHKTTQRLFGGGIMGGLELLQEVRHDESPNWAKIGISTGVGLVFSRPNRLGETLLHAGEHPIETLRGTRTSGDVSRETSPPTVVQAGDLKVLGPGITEEVYRGSHQQAPEAAMTAQQAARDERMLAGEAIEADLHAAARTMDPDLFAHYDDLIERREAFRGWLGEVGQGEAPAAAQHLASIDASLEQIAPQVQAAYRRAAEAHGMPLHGPETPGQTQYRSLAEAIAARGAPMAPVRAVVERPEVAEAIANPKIEHGGDVPYGAGASNESGTTHIDRRIPQYDNRVIGGDGKPLDLWKYLNIHEQAEKSEMERLIATGLSPEEAYKKAHHDIATPAERAAVEADGGDWKDYTAAMDGFLSHIEHEKPENPPADLYVKPYPHAQAETLKAKGAEAPAPGRSIAEQRNFIAADVERQLIAAGRPAAEAKAAGVLIAERYVTRALRLKGLIGSPEELYRREGAQITGPGGAVPPAAPGETPKPAPSAPAAAEPEIVTRHVTGTRRGRAAADPDTWSLLEFLADKGGISSDDPLVGDVRSSIGRSNKLVPSFGALIRKGGMTLDAAREAATEAGYLQGEMTGGKSTRVPDLLDAIDEELRGRRRYRLGFEPAKTRHEIERAQDEHEAHVDQLFADALKESGGDPERVPEHTRARTLEIMMKEKVSDPIAAYERAVMEEDYHGAERGEFEPATEPAEGYDLRNDARAAPEAGGGTAGVRDQDRVDSGGPARAPGGADREAASEGLALRQVPSQANWMQRYDIMEHGEPIGTVDIEPRGSDLFVRWLGFESEEIAPAQLRTLMRELAEMYPNARTISGVRATGADSAAQREVTMRLPQREMELFQKEPAPAFYSAVARAIESIPQAKASPEQWLATLKNRPGVKPEEMQWLGLEDWLKEQHGPVTKQEIADYVRANQIEVREVEKGKGGPPLREELDELAQENYGRPYDELDADHRQEIRVEWEGQFTGGTKFSGYQLPGGENYRELLLTLPPEAGTKQSFVVGVNEQGFYVRNTFNNAMVYDKIESAAAAQRVADGLNEGSARSRNDQDGAFRSSHWDEPNVLAHVRFNDRVIDGKKTLFVEEIQSDWHQKGKKRGYQTPLENPQPWTWTAEAPSTDGPNRGLWVVKDKDGNFVAAVPAATADEAIGSAARGRKPNAVPDAPFKTTWPELALKRMLRYASEHGYDKIAWTTGETQAERYDLSKQISRIDYERTNEGKYEIHAYDHNNKRVLEEDEVPIERIEELVGKEIAKKIEDDVGEKTGGAYRAWRQLSGLDLKVGGEGMAGFYDRILPAAANKLTKKFGGKVQTESIPAGGKAEGETELPEGRPLEVEQKEYYYTITLKDSDLTWGMFNTRETAEARLKILQDAWDKGKTSVHTLDITPSLRDAATQEGFPLFQGARGKIRLAEGRKPIITLMRDANASTFIHESGHQFLEELMRDAEHEAAPDILKNDAKATLDWLGVDSREAIGRRQHEKFARGFEQYLREGVAPSEGLASVFTRFKQWLLSIYNSLKGLGPEISPEVRGVFDRLLALEPRRTVVAPDRETVPTLHGLHETDAVTTEPAEADAAMARVNAEKNRYIEELPPEVRRELETEIARTAPKPEGETTPRTDTGAAVEPPGTPGEGAGGVEPLGDTRGVAEPLAGGGAGGAQHGAVERGGGEARREGADLSAPEGGRGTAQGSGVERLTPSGSDLFGPRESPFVDKAGNIRLENLTTREEVAQAIRDVAHENDDFIGDRRGVVTDGQVLDLAEALGMDAVQLARRKIGQAFNAEQIIAARKLLVQSATDVAELMKQAALGDDHDVMAYAMAKDRHLMIQAQVAGITAEAGRALRAFRNIAGAEQAQNLGEFLKSSTGKTLFQLKEEAKLGASLDTPQKVSKFMADSQKRSFGRMILEYFVNDLISGPATHVTYMVGNAVLLAEKLVFVTPVATAIGAGRRALGREGNVVQFGEVKAGLRGLAGGLAPAIRGVGQSMKAGVTVALPGDEAAAQGALALPMQPGSELAPVSMAEMDTRMRDLPGLAYGAIRGLRDAIVANAGVLAAGGVEGAPLIGTRYSPLGVTPDITLRGMNVLPIGTAIRLPGRMVAAIHTLFRVLNYAVEKAQLDYRTAVGEGHTGEALAQRIAELRSSDQNAVAASEQATGMTLMGQGEGVMRKISGLLNWEANLGPLGPTPVFKFIDPFVQIAGQVVKKSVVEQSPIGVLSAEVRADLSGANGAAAADLAAAKMLVGSAIGMTFMGLAAQGLMTGSGPSDHHEAAVWRLAGNQPHSVRIGDTWYEIHKLGPLGLLASVAADMYEVYHTAEKGELAKAAAHFMHAFTQNFLEEGFMRGPADLIKAIEDSGRYGESYVRNFLSSFLPYSVGMAQVARAVDPYSRQARTVMDEIKRKIPYVSMTLHPRRDIWGEPMTNPEALGAKGLTAIYEKQMSTDPVNLTLLNLEMGIGPVPRKVEGVELTDAQYDDYARIAGRMFKQQLNRIVPTASFRAHSKEIQKEIILDLEHKSRAYARAEIEKKYQDLVTEIRKKQREKHGLPQ